MISVIVPLYNKEKYVHKTIQSICSQSYKDFEIIIVNDGSTDKSMDIVNSINDNRIKVINQKNAGVSVARNTGIKNAKHEYIAFLDADDLWNIDYLKTIFELISLYPEASIYYTSHKKTNKQEPNYNKNEKDENVLVSDYFDFANNGRAIHTSAIVVKKKALETVGLFDTKLSRGEDLYLWTELALKYKIAYSSYVGSFYNGKVVNSLTKKKVALHKSFTSISEEYFHENINFAKNKDSFRIYMENIILVKGKYLTMNGEKETAREFLNRYKNNENRFKVNLMKMITYFPLPIINKLYK